MADLVTFAGHQKPPSPLRAFVDSMQAASSQAQGITPYARAGLHTLRASGTTTVLSSLLGFVDGKWTLDVGRGKHPVDGYLALAGLLGSLVLARDPDGLAVEARAVMATAGGIFLYRKTKAWAESRKEDAAARRRPTLASDVTEDEDEDPVMAAARGLDKAA
jgi:hypothetical protein